MRTAVAISLALAATLAGADVALAGGTHCSLVVRGVNLWHGKCRVTEDEFGFHAEAWSAYQYDQRHPGEQALPEAGKHCKGPWINISPEGGIGSDNDYSAYWSIEDACHGGELVAAIKKGRGAYRGKNFVFTWGDR